MQAPLATSGRSLMLKGIQATMASVALWMMAPLMLSRLLTANHDTASHFSIPLSVSHKRGVDTNASEGDGLLLQYGQLLSVAQP
ncbi:hypothetical protein QBC40DRAFT_276690 [Triangularia verruculosa]|uniref:Uncharacterized protein n=1 Tax=Triangularia verruculosa TaxID=2587418 RepID=A0AAN7AYZ0_9PEZI|nr:hypothetical protein QBC40DRAFT_276690 [Triangularia verruculosa]